MQRVWVPMKKTVLYGFAVSLFWCVFVCRAEAAATGPGRGLTRAETDFLVESFTADGFNAPFLQRIFGDPRLRYIPGLVTRNVVNNEKPGCYKRFLNPVAIGMAKQFFRKWRTRLNRESRASGVDAEVIVAIIMVESSFGELTGSYPVLSVFSSVYLDNRQERRKEIARRLKDRSVKERYLERLALKAQWARRELAALLTMNRDLNVDIGTLKGSYAGAFGIPQFLPSSYLSWGRDGDESDTIDLFYMPDAIASVVHYLKSHGWTSGIHHASNRRVLLAYNKSSAYVETVLQVARRLENGQ